MDYGGFAYVENAKLRQIRGDFMLLPFQAAECVLANITSLNGTYFHVDIKLKCLNMWSPPIYAYTTTNFFSEDGSWPEEAYNLVADIAKGHLIYTQVADYTEEGIPLVLCYIVAGPEVNIEFNLAFYSNNFLCTLL